MKRDARMHRAPFFCTQGRTTARGSAARHWQSARDKADGRAPRVSRHSRRSDQPTPARSASVRASTSHPRII